MVLEGSGYAQVKQHYSSKNTSINSKNFPAVYSHKGFWNDLKMARTILDYGSGRYDNVSRFFNDGELFIGMNKYYFYNSMKSCLQIPKDDLLFYRYDPYWDSDIDLKKVYGNIDVVTCCNVLNVICEEEIIYEIVGKIHRLLGKGGVAWFQIYEGNCSSIGVESKKDCWQRNEKTVDYMKYMEQFHNINRHGLFIRANK